MERTRYIQTIMPRKEHAKLSPDAMTKDKINLVRVGEDVATRKRGLQKLEVGEELEKSLKLGYPTFKAIYVSRNSREVLERYVLDFGDNGAILTRTIISGGTDGELQVEEVGYPIDKFDFEMKDAHVLRTNEEDEIFFVHEFSASGGKSLSEDVDIALEFNELEKAANSQHVTT